LARDLDRALGRVGLERLAHPLPVDLAADRDRRGGGVGQVQVLPAQPE